jgi:hypothetical protein
LPILLVNSAHEKGVYIAENIGYGFPIVGCLYGFGKEPGGSDAEYTYTLSYSNGQAGSRRPPRKGKMSRLAATSDTELI